MNLQTKELQFIEVDFNLPNHANELSKAEDIIGKLKTKISRDIAYHFIDDKKHDLYFEEVVKMLDYVGQLSVPAFTVSNDLEVMYILKFRHAPKLATKLWLDHYEQIHKPYSLLKNRCFRLLEDLDAAYIIKFKKNPPNWEI